VRGEPDRREDEDLRLQQEREGGESGTHRAIGTEREHPGGERAKKERRPLAEDKGVEARLGREERGAEDPVLERAPGGGTPEAGRAGRARRPSA